MPSIYTLPTRSLASVAPVASPARQRSPRAASIALWTAQGLLAGLFLMAGSMKLLMPVEAMAGPVGLPGWFLHVIGVAEVLGAIGLIVPGATRIRPGLTPLAAGGLLVVMVGAVAVTLRAGGGAQAMVPAIVGAVLAAIACGRMRSA